MNLRGKYPDVEDFYKEYCELVRKYGCCAATMENGEDTIKCLKEAVDKEWIDEDKGWDRLEIHLDEIRNNIERKIDDE